MTVEEREIEKAIVVYEDGSTKDVLHGMIVNLDENKTTGEDTEEVTCHFMQASRLDLVTITGAMIMCCEQMGLSNELMAYLDIGSEDGENNGN